MTNGQAANNDQQRHEGSTSVAPEATTTPRAMKYPEGVAALKGAAASPLTIAVTRTTIRAAMVTAIDLKWCEQLREPVDTGQVESMKQCSNI